MILLHRRSNPARSSGLSGVPECAAISGMTNIGQRCGYLEANLWFQGHVTRRALLDRIPDPCWKSADDEERFVSGKSTGERTEWK